MNCDLYRRGLKWIKETFVLLLILSTSYSECIVHIFGDSHALYCFSNNGVMAWREESIFTYKRDITLNIPMVIHWGSCTMHKVGRDGLSYLDISKAGVKEGDICIFVYGEIDVRMHIGRQRDVNERDQWEIIETLTSNYMRTIKANRALFHDVIFVLMSVLPPAYNAAAQPHPNYPLYGTIEDRVAIAKQLNESIESVALKNGFLFLNVYPLYADLNGALTLGLSDGHVHVNFGSNYRIKNLLVELLLDNKIFKNN